MPVDLPVEDLLLEDLLVVFADVVEPFLAADFLPADVDFFLEAPQVDMTSYTVPIVRHPQP